MEPISLILAALVAGAAKGVGKSATAAVGDAYTGLRDALRRRWIKPSSELVTDEFVEDPAGAEHVLAAQLAQAGADSDQDVLAAARRVLELVDPVGAEAGKYVVDLTGAQGVQVGDGNAQTNHFGPQPTTE